MLNFFLESALKNRLWFIAFFGAVVVLGIGAAKTIPIDAVPDITNVQVIVNTKTGALDPEKIEKLVTYPIETEMAGLPGIEDIRSLSKYGLSQVTLVFSESTNIYFARQMVSERLQNVRGTLPTGLSPELAAMTTGLGEVVMYTLDLKPGQSGVRPAMAEQERLTYLREVQDFIIRPHLKSIPGVADVDSNGGFTKQIHINVFPDRLKKFGLSFEGFISKIESLGENFGGGYIQQKGSQIIVRATGRVRSLETIQNLPLSLNMGGTPIRIRDVAKVSVDHSLRLGAATLNGEETVLGTVLMRIGANSRSVASMAEAALAGQIQLPSDVQVTVHYSRTHLVNATIHTILKNLSEGAAFVIVALLLLLGSFRAALIVAAAIPVSMLFALKGMEMLGISANLMSLGAIDFGLLVDGAVVLVENVVSSGMARLKSNQATASEKLKMVLSSSREVIQPVVFGLFIIMLVYVPILYLEGVEGKMFKPMAVTVLLALGASLLATVLLVPVLVYLFLPLPLKHTGEPWLFRFLVRIYEPTLKFSVRKSWFVPTIVILPVIAAGILAPRLGSDFVPQLDEGDLVLNMTRETNQDIDTSVQWQRQADKVAAAFPEVETVFSRIGTPESALDPMGPYLADTFVILKKGLSRAGDRVQGSENTPRRSKTELTDVIVKNLSEKNPHQEIASTQPIEMRFNEILEGSRADVSLRILGPDLDQLMEYSRQAKAILSQMSGLASLETDPLTALTRSPVLDVELNYDKMARYGVSLHDVNGILDASMSGREVGSYYEKDRRFPIILHLDESLRNSVNEIGKVPVGLPGGGTIPLSFVTDIEQRTQVTTVARSQSRRYAALSIYLKDRDMGGFVSEAKERLANQLKLSSDYELFWGGQFKNMEKARERLLVVIPCILVVIFLLLLRNFGSLRHAVLVFSAIPFAMVGGIFSLYFRGIHLSVSAAIGFIALTGIATLNSMVMVSYFNQLRAQGVSLEKTIIQGALKRLRPVAMTALVASLGFLPMAFNTGTGSEVQRPLATVVIGGLITSTLLTLFVIPNFYRWVEDKTKFSSKT